ncbi:MAG: 50S ribosomal protein L19 [Patescibacteria group bacterium]
MKPSETINWKTEIKPGDTVRVVQKVREGEKTRLQTFEGIIIATKHGVGATGTFTVRKVSAGVGVERVFPIHSPIIEKVEITRRATRVRRAKLYYIREKAARDTRKKMRQTRFTASASDRPGRDGEGSGSKAKTEESKSEE